MTVATIDAPPARFRFHWHDGQLRAVDWHASEPDEGGPWPESVAAPMAVICAYFERPVSLDRIPLALRGSDFQLRVWAALRSIPVGETRTYGELAAVLGSGARAVGNACRQNPCPLVVPCHRVVARAGIGGFAGAVDGEVLAIKRWLLRHEGVLA